jgi:hypothetical protein
MTACASVWAELATAATDTDIPEPLIAKAIASAADATPAEARSVAAAIEPWAARCDWRRYLWERERLRDGVREDRLTELWEARASRIADNIVTTGAGLADLALDLQTAKSNAAAAATRLRVVEEVLGFDPDEPAMTRAQIPDSVAGGVMPSVIELVPGAFRPALSGEARPYSRELHRDLLMLLARLPIRVRYSGPVVCVAGEVLARFRLRCPERRARLRLRQAWLRAKCRIREAPDLVQLAWAIEIAVWQQADRVRPHFSIPKLFKRVLERLPNATVCEVNSVLALVNAVKPLDHPESDVSQESGWGALTPHRRWNHLNHALVARDLMFAPAFLRSAFEAGLWDGTTLAWIAHLGAIDMALRAGDLPGECWSALGEQTRADELGGTSDTSTASWQESLSPAYEPGLRLNAAVVLLCERFVRRVTPDMKATLPHVLRSVLSIAERYETHRVRAVTILVSCEVLMEGLGLTFLSEREVNAIRGFAAAAGLLLPADGREALERSLRGIADELAHLDRLLDEQLGTALLDRLAPEARAELRRGVWLYHLGRRSGCGLLNHAVHALARSVHMHLVAAIWQPICAQPDLLVELENTKVKNRKGKMEKLRLPTEGPDQLGEMGFYPLLFRLCRKSVATRTARWFAANVSDTNKLFHLHQELEFFVEHGRNESVHSRQMMLERAEGAYNHLFRDGLLLRLLDLLPALR